MSKCAARRTGFFSPACCLAFLTTLTAASALRADEQVLQNENVQDGDNVYIVGDFAPHEEAAAWLTAPVAGNIVGVQILWWSINPDCEQTIEENIWIRQSGSFPRPGGTLLQLPAPLMSPFFLNEFRYSDEEQQNPIRIPVTAGQTVVVSLEFADGTDIRNGSPSVCRDTTGCRQGKNAIYAPNLGGWVNWCNISGGNFVIRAVLETADLSRVLLVSSDQPGSLVDAGQGFRETPFNLNLREGDVQSLTAFQFSNQGDPFVQWNLDGQFFSANRSITVSMNSGDDRTASAIYSTVVPRTLSVHSDVADALVDAGNGYQPTPFDLATAEGNSVQLKAFGFSPLGDPFMYWELDGAFFSDQTTIDVVMDAGADRTASAVYLGQSCGELISFKAKGGSLKAITTTQTTLTAGKVTVECAGGSGSGSKTKSIKPDGKAKATVKNLPPGDYTCTLKKIKDGSGATLCEGDLASDTVTVTP